MRRIIVATVLGMALAVIVTTALGEATAPSAGKTTTAKRERVRVRKRVRVRVYGPHHAGLATYYTSDPDAAGACETGVGWGKVALNGLPCGTRIHVIHARRYRPLWGRSEFVVTDKCGGCSAFGVDVWRPCGCGWSNPTLHYRAWHYGYRWRWRWAWRWRRE